jgi:hypothetical protein
MIFQDYQLDENGDLLIVNGDFVVGASDQQHVVDILQAFQGEYKEFSLLGVGFLSYLKSDNPNSAINSIKEHLQSDGYDVKNVKINKDANGNISVSFPNNGISRNV